MVSVLLLAVLLGSVVAIVLMVYLIDRVKRLEVLSLQVTNNLAQAAAAPPASDNGFLGLSGKVLWDAMSGNLPEGFKQADLVALKNRFEFVLQNHISSVFKLGKDDALKGSSQQAPSNPLDVKTLRGSLASWIPAQHVAAIYKTGYESVTADEIGIQRLQADIDEVASILFSRTGMTIKQLFSERLFPAAAVAPVAPPSSDTLIGLDENSAGSEGTADSEEPL